MKNPSIGYADEANVTYRLDFDGISDWNRFIIAYLGLNTLLAYHNKNSNVIGVKSCSRLG